MTCTAQRLLPLPASNSPRLLAARDFAGRNYSGQRRGDPERYEAHLVAVESVARRFGVPADLGVGAEDFLVAGWLHDTVENTRVPLSSIRSEFGDPVANLVAAVSDRPGDTRSQRHRATYPYVAATPGAVRLKLVDRIANVEVALGARDEDILGCYRSEGGSFRAALHTPGGNQVLWAHLELLYEAIDRL